MLLGILLLSLMGLSWMLTGVFISYASRHHCDIKVVNAGTAIGLSLVGLPILTLQGLPHAPARLVLLTTGVLVGSGIINYYTNALSVKAMRYGPNGIIWALYQSAMIFPFTLGLLFYGGKASAFRLGGIAVLLVGILLLGITGDNRANKRAVGQVPRWVWLVPTITCFFLNGLSQFINTIPSYYSGIEAISSVYRTTIAQVGAIAAFSVNFAFDGSLRRRWNQSEWLMIAINLITGLIACYYLMYKGMDLLAKAGAGSISYPIPVGVCIISFTLYSALKMHERYDWKNWLGLTLCTIGVIAITL